MRTRTPEQGSTLIIVMMLMMLLGGFVIALQSVSWHRSRAARVALAEESARLAAESGIAYFLAECRADEDFFRNQPAPHAPRTFGGSTFVLDSADAIATDWNLVLTGLSDGVSVTVAATLGSATISIPTELKLAGTGDSEDTALTIDSGSIVGAYDGAVESFDALSPSDGEVHVAGSLEILNSSTSYGDVTLSGDLEAGIPSSVSGTLTENGTVSATDDIDAIVDDHLTRSKAANDNANLTAIFGASWTPIAGTENYGDLIISGSGTYVIPAGTYRFRQINITGGATVIFDTSTAPSTLTFVGGGTETTNDFLLENSSKIQIDAGGSSHGLTTVMAEACDLRIDDGSQFGQEINATSSSGYHQLIGKSRNGTDFAEVLNQSEFYGRFHAVSHGLQLSGQSKWYGSAVAKTAQVLNTSTFAIDTSAQGTGLPIAGERRVVASWRMPDTHP